MHDISSLPLGVFDSGIGGLTVVHSLLQTLPHENIIYFGDTARVPYGPKSPETVRSYAKQDAHFLVSQQVKMIVIACNTVSAVALDVVQKEANVPVVGVIVPGAKSAIQSSKKKRIGVIGTKATIASNAYTNAIRLFDSDAKVFGKACPLFVPLAEEGLTNHQATEMIAKEYLFSFKQEKIDTLVLGCTHYPILSPIIQKSVGEDVTLIDSGVAVAEEVQQLLEEKNLRNTSKHKPNILFYVSDVPEKFTEVGERFLGMKMGKVRRAEGFLI
jgi:glutamate racemase